MRLSLAAPLLVSRASTHLPVSQHCVRYRSHRGNIFVRDPKLPGDKPEWSGGHKVTPRKLPMKPSPRSAAQQQRSSKSNRKKKKKKAKQKQKPSEAVLGVGVAGDAVLASPRCLPPAFVQSLRPGVVVALSTSVCRSAPARAAAAQPAEQPPPAKQVTCFDDLVQASGATAEELQMYSAEELVELLQKLKVSIVYRKRIVQELTTERRQHRLPAAAASAVHTHPIAHADSGGDAEGGSGSGRAEAAAAHGTDRSSSSSGQMTGGAAPPATASSTEQEAATLLPAIAAKIDAALYPALAGSSVTAAVGASVINAAMEALKQDATASSQQQQQATHDYEQQKALPAQRKQQGRANAAGNSSRVRNSTGSGTRSVDEVPVTPRTSRRQRRRAEAIAQEKLEHEQELYGGGLDHDDDDEEMYGNSLDRSGGMAARVSHTEAASSAAVRGHRSSSSSSSSSESERGVQRNRASSGANNSGTAAPNPHSSPTQQLHFDDDLLGGGERAFDFSPVTVTTQHSSGSSEEGEEGAMAVEAVGEQDVNAATSLLDDVETLANAVANARSRNRNSANLTLADDSTAAHTAIAAAAAAGGGGAEAAVPLSLGLVGTPMSSSSGGGVSAGAGSQSSTPTVSSPVGRRAEAWGSRVIEPENRLIQAYDEKIGQEVEVERLAHSVALARLRAVERALDEAEARQSALRQLNSSVAAASPMAAASSPSPRSSGVIPAWRRESESNAALAEEVSFHALSPTHTHVVYVYSLAKSHRVLLSRGMSGRVWGSGSGGWLSRRRLSAMRRRSWMRSGRRWETRSRPLALPLPPSTSLSLSLSFALCLSLALSLSLSLCLHQDRYPRPRHRLLCRTVPYYH
eukprot:COSAG05_NODE_963_length_6408_cov_4.077984_5_plen_859_part_00